MKKLFTLVAILFSSLSFASDIDHCEQMVPFGFPTVKVEQTEDLCRIAYFVKHDNTNKVPTYSAEYLEHEAVNTDGVTRVDAFKPDPDLAPSVRAELSDYSGKGYDRGHMTPFEDLHANTAMALQSFYLSNMVPQDAKLNRGLWRSIEMKTRVWATQSKDGLYVITGPVFDGATKKIGNGVGVPTHIFKVLIDKSSNQGIAFLVPNNTPPKNVKLENYIVTITDVENASGINFTPELSDPAKLAWKKQIGTQFK
jgi:endonuclease G